MASPDVGRRRPILGVSTKMYFSIARTREYVDALTTLFAADEKQAQQNTEAKSRGSILDRIDVFICPDFITLPSIVEQLRASHLRLQLGAQDCGWEDYGAFTGFVSPAVLADVGVRIVEVGHAERRRLLGETDATTAAKAVAAVRHGLVPLVCVGETTAPLTEAGGDISTSAAAAAILTIVSQVTPVLDAVPDTAEVLLAYEPVWAIGAAHPASAAYVRAVVSGVRTSCAAIQRRGAARTRILYGGSAGPGLFTQLGGVVDGLFLGRFGHDPSKFMKTAQELADEA